MSPAGTPQVTIAVVSWNTRALLDACLHSLRPEFEAGRAEAWVVDNGSQDGSPELVREAHPWAELLEPGENLGFGRAVNLVAARTRTAWIAPANADIELTPGALQTLVAAGEAHPRAGAVAPRLVLPGGATQHSVYSFPTLPFTFLFNAGIAEAVPSLADRLALEGRWNAERARWVPWAVGAFLLVRRTAWDAAGGFDPAQWMYAEDLDLGWRLHRAGWRTWYEPSAHVLHHESAAARAAWGEERHERWQRATYDWLERRRGVPRARATAALNVAGAGARWALARARGGEGPASPAAFRAWAALHWRTGLRR